MINNVDFSDCEKNVLYILGTLNWKIYNCITDRHTTDIVIITAKQLAHIKNRRSETSHDVLKYIKDTLNDPDYIFKAKQEYTGLVVKRIPEKNTCTLLVLKIITSGETKGYRNSVLTGWKISEKRLHNYLNNKEIIYKKE